MSAIVHILSFYPRLNFAQTRGSLLLRYLLLIALALVTTQADATASSASLAWPKEGGDEFRDKLQFLVTPKNQYHQQNLPPISSFKTIKGFRHPQTQSDIWVRFTIHETEGKAQDLNLKLTNLMFDVIDIYQRQPNGNFILAKQLGDHHRLSKEVGIFRFQLNQYQQNEFLIKLRNRGAFNIPLSLLNDLETYQLTIKNTAVMSAFYATLFALTLTYFILIKNNLRRSDSYFLINSILAGLCYAHIDGAFHLFFSENWTKIANLEIFIYLYAMSWSMLVKNCLNIKHDKISAINIYFIYALLLISSIAMLGEATSLLLNLETLNRKYILPFICILAALIISFNIHVSSYRSTIIISSGIPCIILSFYLCYLDLIGTNRPYDIDIGSRLMFIVNLLVAVYALRKQSISHFKTQLESAQRKRSEDINLIEQDQMIEHISTSLRTPMNSLTGMVDLIRSTQLDSTQRHCVDIIDRSSADLVRLIDNFEDYNSRNSCFNNEVNETFSLEDCIINCCHSYTDSALKKNIDLLYDQKYDTGHKFIGDPVKLRKITSKLLDNAINYSSNSDIKITSTLGQADDSNRIKVIVWIQNRIGGNIDDHIDNIDAFFMQPDKASQLKGLDIAQQLLTSIGGELKHEISQNQVRIGFSLDLELETKAIRREDRSLSDHNCLIIAPKSSRVDLLQKQLDMWQMRSEHISSIETLNQAYLERHHFDCCIIDTDCKFTLSYINNSFMRDFQAFIPPAAFISYTLNQPNINPEHFHWNTKVLAKPIHRGKLKTALKMLSLSKGEAADYISLSNTAPIPTSRTLNVTPIADGIKDYQHHRVMVAEDNAVNRQVMQRLLSKLNISCDFCNNGYEVTTALCEKNRTYTVVLMDCDMPGIDGFSATKKIRQYEKRHALAAVTIIAVTSITGEAQIEKAKSSGMDGFIRKPVNLDILRHEFDQLDHKSSALVTKIY